MGTNHISKKGETNGQNEIKSTITRYITKGRIRCKGQEERFKNFKENVRNEIKVGDAFLKEE